MLLIVSTKAITSSKFRNIGYFNSDLLFKEISEFCIKLQYYPHHSVLCIDYSTHFSLSNNYFPKSYRAFSDNEEKRI